MAAPYTMRTNASTLVSETVHGWGSNSATINRDWGPSGPSGRPNYHRAKVPSQQGKPRYNVEAVMGVRSLPVRMAPTVVRLTSRDPAPIGWRKPAVPYRGPALNPATGKPFYTETVRLSLEQEDYRRAQDVKFNHFMDATESEDPNVVAYGEQGLKDLQTQAARKYAALSRGVAGTTNPAVLAALAAEAHSHASTHLADVTHRDQDSGIPQLSASLGHRDIQDMLRERELRRQNESKRDDSLSSRTHARLVATLQAAGAQTRPGDHSKRFTRASTRPADSDVDATTRADPVRTEPRAGPTSVSVSSSGSNRSVRFAGPSDSAPGSYAGEQKYEPPDVAADLGNEPQAGAREIVPEFARVPPDQYGFVDPDTSLNLSAILGRTLPDDSSYLESESESAGPSPIQRQGRRTPSDPVLLGSLTNRPTAGRIQRLQFVASSDPHNMDQQLDEQPRPQADVLDDRLSATFGQPVARQTYEDTWKIRLSKSLSERPPTPPQNARNTSFDTLSQARARQGALDDLARRYGMDLDVVTGPNGPSVLDRRVAEIRARDDEQRRLDFQRLGRVYALGTVNMSDRPPGNEVVVPPPPPRTDIAPAPSPARLSAVSSPAPSPARLSAVPSPRTPVVADRPTVAAQAEAEPVPTPVAVKEGQAPTTVTASTGASALQPEARVMGGVPAYDYAGFPVVRSLFDLTKFWLPNDAVGPSNTTAENWYNLRPHMDHANRSMDEMSDAVQAFISAGALSNQNRGAWSDYWREVFDAARRSMNERYHRMSLGKEYPADELEILKDERDALQGWPSDTAADAVYHNGPNARWPAGSYPAERKGFLDLLQKTTRRLVDRDALVAKDNIANLRTILAERKRIASQPALPTQPVLSSPPKTTSIEQPPTSAKATESVPAVDLSDTQFLEGFVSDAQELQRVLDETLNISKSGPSSRRTSVSQPPSGATTAESSPRRPRRRLLANPRRSSTSSDDSDVIGYFERQYLGQAIDLGAASPARPQMPDIGPAPPAGQFADPEQQLEDMDVDATIADSPEATPAPAAQKRKRSTVTSTDLIPFDDEGEGSRLFNLAKRLAIPLDVETRRGPGSMLDVDSKASPSYDTKKSQRARTTFFSAIIEKINARRDFGHTIDPKAIGLSKILQDELLSGKEVYENIIKGKASQTATFDEADNVISALDSFLRERKDPLSLPTAKTNRLALTPTKLTEEQTRFRANIGDVMGAQVPDIESGVVATLFGATVTASNRVAASAGAKSAEKQSSSELMTEGNALVRFTGQSPASLSQQDIKTADSIAHLSTPSFDAKGARMQGQLVVDDAMRSWNKSVANALSAIKEVDARRAVNNQSTMFASMLGTLSQLQAEKNWTKPKITQMKGIVKLLVEFGRTRTAPGANLHELFTAGKDAAEQISSVSEDSASDFAALNQAVRAQFIVGQADIQAREIGAEVQTLRNELAAAPRARLALAAGPRRVRINEKANTLKSPPSVPPAAEDETPRGSKGRRDRAEKERKEADERLNRPRFGVSTKPVKPAIRRTGNGIQSGYGAGAPPDDAATTTGPTTDQRAVATASDRATLGVGELPIYDRQPMGPLPVEESNFYSKTARYPNRQVFGTMPFTHDVQQTATSDPDRRFNAKRKIRPAPGWVSFDSGPASKMARRH